MTQQPYAQPQYPGYPPQPPAQQGPPQWTPPGQPVPNYAQQQYQQYAQQYPQQVICVELNRGFVADPFVPFGEAPISPAKVEKMVAPIARVVARASEG